MFDNLHGYYFAIFDYFLLDISDVDECKSLPCKNNASCVDGVNTYTCECAPGFKGKDCGISTLALMLLLFLLSSAV